MKVKGGVVVEVANVVQALVAQNAGAVAVMVLADRQSGARSSVKGMSDLAAIRAILSSVSIPVMARTRAGHFFEAQILQALGTHYIDETEPVSAAVNIQYIDKRNFTVPFICGAANLGEALRHVADGASIIRSRGSNRPGALPAGMVAIRRIAADIAALTASPRERLHPIAEELGVPTKLVEGVADTGKLPVPLFGHGPGTPADAAMMMQFGADGLFVGSEIFAGTSPTDRAACLVRAATFHEYPEIVAMLSCGFAEPFAGTGDHGSADADTFPREVPEGGMYPFPRWSRLRGAEVEVRFSGKKVRGGFVDMVMPDDSALWLGADGADGRALFEAAAGYEVWVEPATFQTRA
ncbi:Pyridoxal 5'-phosphate synthase subunit PdxS [Paenarthrobacter nicotinovorans]|nr:pyridoxal 5'-phosphate synthase lyase subunit PdxS [Paenarthrobacter nicotinovorans]MDI2019761.1 Pyridoxal 5'-phosphate synthase subunit PdxS [Paenarthrobacter nicotinovorans]